MSLSRSAIAFGLLVGVLQGCSAPIPRIPVRADLDGETVVTTVDSDIAAYYASDYLSGRRSRPKLDQAIDAVHREVERTPPGRALFASLNKQYSTDFAALVLWQRLTADPNNREANEVFEREFDRITKSRGAGATAERPFPRDYLILFVPGWFYRSQPESGADFAGPRAVLSALGARTALVQTDENGSVESNAAQVASAIVEASRSGENLILVSASKAGAEVALALSTLQRSGQAGSVKAWVNIGGLLHGTALADIGTEWPGRWYVRLFMIGDRSFDGIESLTTKKSLARASAMQLPPEMLVINYVGIPLSGQISERARPGYKLLRREGPNDGLTQIVDEIAPGSITIVELGLDHYFDHAEIQVKTGALAWTVLHYRARLAEARAPETGLQPASP
jgi:hypothetical protein